MLILSSVTFENKIVVTFIHTTRWQLTTTNDSVCTAVVTSPEELCFKHPFNVYITKNYLSTVYVYNTCKNLRGHFACSMCDPGQHTIRVNHHSAEFETAHISLFSFSQPFQHHNPKPSISITPELSDYTLKAFPIISATVIPHESVIILSHTSVLQWTTSAAVELSFTVCLTSPV